MGIRLILLFLYMLISIDLTQFVTRLISSQAGCRCKYCILQYVYEMWGVLEVLFRLKFIIAFIFLFCCKYKDRYRSIKSISDLRLLFVLQCYIDFTLT